MAPGPAIKSGITTNQPCLAKRPLKALVVVITAITHAHPSFGVTITKAFRDLLA